MNNTHIKKINKKTGKWKKTEHQRFMKAIEKYGKNWVEIQKYVKSRSLAQVRSHAQKILTHLSKQEKRILQMKDFQRMVDFCKVKDSCSEQNTKKQRDDISIKSQEKQEVQVKKDYSQTDIKQENLIKIQHVNTAEIILGSSLDNQFYFGNYQNYKFQVPLENIYQYGNQWEYYNPYTYFGLQFLANPPINQIYNRQINQLPTNQ